MVNQDRWQVTIQDIDASGSLGTNKNKYPNVCNECMAEVRKAISNLDMSKPSGASNESC